MLQSLTSSWRHAGRWLIAITLAACAVTANADERADAQRLVDAATRTFDNFRADPNMAWFRNHVRDAKGIMVVPELGKAGFIFGGSGGSGVLLGRSGRGWSQPAFYTMASVTFGLQIGAEVAEVVLMIMTDRGMDAMYSTEFKLGVDVSVAAGPVGAGAQAATADVLAFSRAKGVFGGITVEGAGMSPNDDWNRAYYGRDVRALEIISQGKVRNRGADRLRNTIAGAAGGGGGGTSSTTAAAGTGSGGYDVLTIQQSLKAKGFDPGRPDGKMGPATRRAIRGYQSAQGLPVTGAPSLELQRHLATH